MNWVDYSILAIIAVSVLISLWRGFTKEALSLAGWIVAAWVALTFSDKLQPLLEPHITVPSLRLIVAFAALFIVTLFLAGLVNYLAVQLIKKTGLSGTDRMAGILFGVARGVLVVALLVLVGGMTPVPQDPWWREAQLLHYFQDIAVWMQQFLPEDIAKSIHY
ncbi:MAG: CvpA family protein [Gammaproteobacteria bacterium]|nr:CvpA family protein [Gammaproteobacteria bacterium]MCW8840636.1 CvpA family protein [Gammaproteobacteria bacterium]MCW8958467.1 CvpA family protein [Gammaproteobacteria bacterium]MCW8972265.1 CvpA family protein [Gammaproteobacteria bacterium]MCW8991860.1 CvpA family protein [Gammaproteobacteria bacterium]